MPQSIRQNARSCQGRARHDHGEPPVGRWCQEAQVQITRLVSLTDLVVMIVVAVALFLPPRPVTADAVARLDPDTQLALAFAEARARAHPDDGAAVADLSRRLGEAGQLDWAVQVAAAAANAGADSPTRWRAEVAVSVAHAD